MTGVGERMHDERRRKFWRLIFFLAAAGALGGFVFGFVHGRADATGEPIGETARLIAAVALVLSAIGGAYGSWRFFANADEVEVADNLWGSLVGFYLYAFTLPTWWALHWLEVAPEPNDWIIFAAAILSATAAYGYRKWRSG